MTDQKQTTYDKLAHCCRQKKNGDARNRKHLASEREHVHHREEMKKVYSERVDDYVHSFTIHGLTRVISAPRWEALAWLVALSLGIFLSILIVKNLVSKYQRYEVYNDIRYIATKQNNFPSLTICEDNLFKKASRLYCGSPIYDSGNNTNERWKTCDYRNLKRAPEQNSVRKSYINGGKNWSNGMFEILKCSSWSSVECENSTYFRSHTRLNHSCMTWNYNGDFHDSFYGRAELRFKFLRTDLGNRPSIVVYLHDAGVMDFDFTKTLNVKPREQYDIFFHKTKIIRQPSPYPSNCVKKGSKEAFDVISDGYSRYGCAESRKLTAMYEQCGDVPDYAREIIAHHIEKKYKKQNKGNNTILEIKKCLRKFLNNNRGLTKSMLHLCAFPCEETELLFKTFKSSFDDRDIEKMNMNKEDMIYSIDLQFQSVDTYRIFHEKPLYSLQQMMSEIGGFLGLVIGASVLSFIELFVCSAFAFMFRMTR